MPFTLAHPLAVVPLHRGPLVLSAFVAGSVAPDVVYFVPTPVTSALTHSLPGLVTADVPIAVALVAVLYAAAPPLVALASPPW